MTTLLLRTLYGPPVPPSRSALGLGQNVPFMNVRDFAREVILCKADLVSYMRVKESKLLK